jgi:hypothetical protein
MLPGFSVSYHAFDANDNPIIVSFEYGMIELMTNARDRYHPDDSEVLISLGIISFLEAVTFDAVEARSGMPIFAAWLVMFINIFIVIVLGRFVYILFFRVDLSSEAGKFAFNMTMLAVAFIVAFSYFMNPISFEAPIRLFGLGTQLSPAHQFSMDMFPLLIVQYIIFLTAAFSRFFLIRKLDKGLAIYFHEIREFNDVRTVTTWDCKDCDKVNFYYNVFCSQCGRKVIV